MELKTRLILWALAAYLIPIGIVIYENGYDDDAMRWATGVTVFAIIVEVINYIVIKRRMK